MRVEVDQSVRVEETNRDTVLALANNIAYSICISSQVKKALLKMLRTSEQSDKFIYLKIFTAGLIILLRDYQAGVAEIIIDREYPGKETFIKSRLLQFLEKKNFEVGIHFQSIGKNHMHIM